MAASSAMLRFFGASVGGGIVLAALLATPASTQPKPIQAGSIVTASVRVVLDGTRVRPVRVACAGTIGGERARGTPKATRGKASCIYRTTTAAKGLTLRGAVSFTARGARYVRRFAVRLV